MNQFGRVLQLLHLLHHLLGLLAHGEHLLELGEFVGLFVAGAVHSDGPVDGLSVLRAGVPVERVLVVLGGEREAGDGDR